MQPTHTSWAADAVFYHMYPLGLCGAPARNDFRAPPEPRLAALHACIPHLRSLGVDALYLGPLFESTAHGYDTADYYHVDRRLGGRLRIDPVPARGTRILVPG